LVRRLLTNRKSVEMAAMEARINPGGSGTPYVYVRVISPKYSDEISVDIGVVSKNQIGNTDILPVP